MRIVSKGPTDGHAGRRFDGNTAHMTALARIVVQREVPDRPIVPEGDGSGSPREAAGKRFVAGVLEEKIK